MPAKTRKSITLEDLSFGLITLQKQLAEGLSGLRGEMGGLHDELSGFRGELGGQRGEIAILRYDMTSLHGKVDGLSLDMSSLKKEFRNYKELTEAGFDTMNERFDYVDDRFDGVDARLDRMDPPAAKPNFYER